MTDRTSKINIPTEVKSVLEEPPYNRYNNKVDFQNATSFYTFHLLFKSIACRKELFHLIKENKFLSLEVKTNN